MVADRGTPTVCETGDREESTSMEVLIAAVVGVCGTLCATWLTQRSAERSREAERRDAEHLRRAEGKAREEERMYELRRANYIALNQAARRYFGALANELHRLPSDGGGAGREPMEELADLEEVRIAYRACYAEAQMVVPDSVLTVASAVNRELNQAYGILKRLHAGTPRERDDPRQVRAHLDAARGLLHDLRRDMRLDLGITVHGPLPPSALEPPPGARP
ncbi:hypothetical protein ACFU5P_04885 [Streptomyces sp. NPDC057433]|uniref:hypothetical protein n=1 Tax=Streptomyces sp. NPDC057433 TaxID=3346132 RepID=UPI0036C85390